jgi:hypothetical protein
VLLGALLAVVLAAACGDSREVTPPVSRADPGPVVLRLAAPDADNRAMLVEVTGPGIDSITSPLRVVGTVVDASTHRLVLDGAVAPGRLATLWMADRRSVGTVTARVTQAVSSDYRQRDVTGYSMTLER